MLFLPLPSGGGFYFPPLNKPKMYPFVEKNPPILLAIRFQSTNFAASKTGKHGNRLHISPLQSNVEGNINQQSSHFAFRRSTLFYCLFWGASRRQLSPTRHSRESGNLQLASGRYVRGPLSLPCLLRQALPRYKVYDKLWQLHRTKVAEPVEARTSVIPAKAGTSQRLRSPRIEDCDL